jgi:hypothetical protein
MEENKNNINSNNSLEINKKIADIDVSKFKSVKFKINN